MQQFRMLLGQQQLAAAQTLYGYLSGWQEAAGQPRLRRLVDALRPRL